MINKKAKLFQPLWSTFQVVRRWQFSNASHPLKVEMTFLHSSLALTVDIEVSVQSLTVHGIYMVQVQAKHLVVVVHKKFYNLPNCSQLMRVYWSLFGKRRTQSSRPCRMPSKLWQRDAKRNLESPPCWSRSGTSEVKSAEASSAGPGVNKEHQSNNLFWIKFHLFL